MNEQLEIEFKTILTKEEYQSLQFFFDFSESDFFIQENYYYDTEDKRLAHLNSGLRIRLLPDSAECTLKTPLGLDKIETTDFISFHCGKELIKKNQIKHDGFVAKKLEKLSISPKSVHLIGSLTTKRAVKKVAEGIMVLDKSFYDSQVDHELEFETKNSQTGELFFNSFLKKQGIKRQKAKNKVVRMIEAKARK